MPNEIRLAIRGYLGPIRQFEQNIEADEEQLGNLIGQLAERHAEAMAACQLDMIELEFLDEPNVNARFFRIGTSPVRMVMPIALDLGKLPD